MHGHPCALREMETGPLPSDITFIVGTLAGRGKRAACPTKVGIAMSDLSKQNPLDRFSGLAEVYARCRPDYPDAALDYVVERCALGPDTLTVDVGAGTGISARLLALR